MALPGVVLVVETVELTLLEELVVEAVGVGVPVPIKSMSGAGVSAGTTRDPRGFIPGTFTVVHCKLMSLP